ncbi:MAG: adenine phosphoribosyltransferase [Bacilli bacterium]|nr:adenine phosphoribosyltransferase [Bacilli bacterium]
MDLKKYIGVTEGFPKPGISWKDISPLLACPEAYRECIDRMAAWAEDKKPTIIIGPESRGFVFGCPLAYKMGIPFAMARKAGKLPGKTVKIAYNLEYGTDELEIPANSLKKGDRVLLVDDLMATGGTFRAMKGLCELADVEIVGAVTAIELTDLNGRENIGIPFEAIIQFNR